MLALRPVSTETNEKNNYREPLNIRHRCAVNIQRFPIFCGVGPRLIGEKQESVFLPKISFHAIKPLSQSISKIF